MPFAGRNGHGQTFIYFGRFKDVTSCSTLSFLTKSLKIAKGLSEVVNRRTDNTMAKRKKTENTMAKRKRIK
jgi:hypothetical protein